MFSYAHTAVVVWLYKHIITPKRGLHQLALLGPRWTHSYYAGEAKTSFSITSLYVCVYSAADPAAQVTSSTLLMLSLSLFNFCVYFCRSCRKLALVLPAQVSASSPYVTSAALHERLSDYIYIQPYHRWRWGLLDELFLRCPENKTKNIHKCHIFSSRDGHCEQTESSRGQKQGKWSRKWNANSRSNHF